MNSRHLCYMAIAALLILGSIEARAQQGMAINSTGAAANASAMLDVSSTSKGVLVPRMASTASVASPATGLMIYNTTTNQFNYFNGTSWVAIGSGSVTNFSSGNLSPLFTTTVSNLTTTPSLSFTPSNIPAFTVLGNATNAPGQPIANPSIGYVKVNSNMLLALNGTASTGNFYQGDATWAPPFTLTTTGSSGAATFSGGILNIPTYSGGSGTVTSITAGTGLSGGTITTSGTISMPNTGTPGTYGSATQVPVITTDAQGRVTSVTNTSIAGGYVFNAVHGTGAAASPATTYTEFLSAFTARELNTSTPSPVTVAFDIVPAAMTLDAMYVTPIISATYISGPVNVYTATVFKNGAATPMVVTITTGTTNPAQAVLATQSDIIHTVALAAGDKVSIRWAQTNTGNGELANFVVGFHAH